MKILKYVLLFILAVVVIGLIYVSMQPGNYDVKRSKIIKAPVSATFNMVNEFRNWEKWGPWHEKDSTIVVSYSGKTVGVGASYTWTSKKDGPGNMKTAALVANESIDQKIQFGDFEPTDVYWKFEEVTEGTKVTWGMKAEKVPFIFKMMSAVSGGFEKMFGEMEEQGLENINTLMEAEMKLANSFTIGQISTVDVEGRKFIGYHHKIKIDMEKMTELFMNDLPKVGAYAAENGLKQGDYIPGSVYTKWDEAAGETEFYIGLLLDKDIKPAEGMSAINLPVGKAAMISKFGNYGNGDEKAHEAIDKFLKVSKKEMKYPIWELYVNDPSQVKPYEIQTDIYYPIK